MIPFLAFLFRLILHHEDCHQSYFDLMSILAPYVQYNGSSQGVILEPANINDLQENPALVHTPAMARALEIYKQLYDMSPNSSADAKCDDGGAAPADAGRGMARSFANGSCLMGVALGDFFKVGWNRYVVNLDCMLGASTRAYVRHVNVASSKLHK